MDLNTLLLLLLLVAALAIIALLLLRRPEERMGHVLRDEQRMGRDELRGQLDSCLLYTSRCV